MSDTEILSSVSENGDSTINKKRMSERDDDSSDESSSYDDKVQNGVNGRDIHSNGKEDEDESEDEGSHGFRVDGEPDYKPRKVYQIIQILYLRILFEILYNYMLTLIGMRTVNIDYIFRIHIVIC